MNHQLPGVCCHVFHALIGAQPVLIAVLVSDNLFVVVLLGHRAVFLLFVCHALVV